MRKSVILLSVTVLLVFTTTDCRKFDLDVDDLEINLDLNIIKSTYTIVFIDGESGQQIGAEDETTVICEMSGEDRSLVVDPSGHKFDEWKSAGGVLVLALDPYKKVPNPENPVSFTVVAKCEGYADVYHTVRIDTISNRETEILMMKLSSPPDGVDVLQLRNIGVASDGRLQETINVSTPEGKAQLSLVKGAVLKTEEGVPLSGNLSLRCVAYPTPYDAKSDLLPGGLTGVVVDSTGESTIHFYSAGYVDIVLQDEAGREAAKIEQQDIDLKFRFQPDLYNEETGTIVKEGDMIPMYTYNEESGKWYFEKRVRVESSSQGLYTEASLSHLSVWNFGWTGSTSYYSKRFVMRAGRYTFDNWYYKFKVHLFVIRPDETVQYYGNIDISGGAWTGGPVYPKHYFEFRNVPLDRKVRLVFGQEDYWCTEPYWHNPGNYTGYIFNPSNSPTYEFKTIWPVSPVAKIKANVTIICTDQKNRRIKPTQPVTYRVRVKDAGTCWSTLTKRVTEEITVQVHKGQIWEIQVYFDGKWQPRDPYLLTIKDDVVWDRPNNITLDFEIPMKCSF